MDPAILLRTIHDLQARIIHMENELAAATVAQAKADDSEPVEDDAEVR